MGYMRVTGQVLWMERCWNMIDAVRVGTRACPPYWAREPGETSNHSQIDVQGNPSGNAVDIAFVPDNANISADDIACQCNMYRPLINMPDPTKNDTVHYQPRICPR